MKRIITLLALLASISCFAQIETETHVFWQPGAKLTFDMFQGTPADSAYAKKLTDINVYHQVATGLSIGPLMRAAFGLITSKNGCTSISRNWSKPIRSTAKNPAAKFYITGQ